MTAQQYNSSKIAALFPGQLSECPGMAEELHQTYPYVRDLFAEIERHSDVSIPAHFFGAGSPRLHENAPAEVGLFGTGIAILDVMAHEFDYVPDAAAGYSLGTYAAFVAAGCLDRWDALEVLLEVQRLLDSGAYPGGMGYVIGLNRARVEEAMSSISPSGKDLWIGNENAPQQFVLTGDEMAVRACIEVLRPQSLAAELLPLTSPMHSPRLAPLTDQVRKFVASRVEVRPPSPTIALYAPMLGGRVTTREEAFDILCCQLARPSRWDSMLNAMWTDGCHKFIEAGPGHVLARMLRWTLRQAKVQVLEDPMSIERFVMGRHTPGFEPARPGMEGEPS